MKFDNACSNNAPALHSCSHTVPEELLDNLVQKRRELGGDGLVGSIQIVRGDDDQGEIRQLMDTCVGSGRMGEGLGDEGETRCSLFFQVGCIEQTARGAGASFSETVDHAVVAAEPRDHVGFRRT